MQITIHNINDLKTIDYRELTNLQGTLKDLDEANEKKLFNVLDKRGFRTPLFVYRDKGGSIYLMDGHQRVYVMTKNDMNDNGSYLVPYVEIPAKNLQEAQAMLLEITSQYGTVTKEGLDKYLQLAKLPVAKMLETVSLDALASRLPSTAADELSDEFSLDDGDKSPFSQLTFTVSDEQKQIIKSALERAKGIEGETYGNENGNGNALYWIVEQWLAQNN